MKHKKELELVISPFSVFLLIHWLYQERKPFNVCFRRKLDVLLNILGKTLLDFRNIIDSFQVIVKLKSKVGFGNPVQALFL